MTPAVEGPGSTYAAAGVDIAAGEQAVELIRGRLRSSRPEVVGGLGGFAGLFRIDERRYLATSTDGVGTKIAIAQALDRHDTIGIDLVGMVVDDLVVCGAEPLYLTDYIACGRVVPERIADIVAGVDRGCELAGCALIGGETAEHPGLLGPDDYDLAGAGTGVVDIDRLLSAERVRPGDAVVAMASSGLHANGYSLVRHVLLRAARLSLDAEPPELGGARLGDVLLTPTRIYARDCLALAAAVDVHAYAHITGGGLAANLARVLPAGVVAILDRGSWTPPGVFRLVAERGRVAPAEMERTLNQGVGMVAVLPAGDAAAAVGLLAGRGVPAWVVGELLPVDGSAPGSARLVGTHPA
ncbi:MAG TPA: phosphoribosylformylglycinamidine cyclo-ligase [Mycobacteriales bacterium]|nr:phosphoribosylformylglycinamidine cyclo-ligase [Mycobacteriales bacterium]